MTLYAAESPKSNSSVLHGAVKLDSSTGCEHMAVPQMCQCFASQAINSLALSNAAAMIEDATNHKESAETSRIKLITPLALTALSLTEEPASRRKAVETAPPQGGPRFEALWPYPGLRPLNPEPFKGLTPLNPTPLDPETLHCTIMRPKPALVRLIWVFFQGWGTQRGALYRASEEKRIPTTELQVNVQLGPFSVSFAVLNLCNVNLGTCP